MSGELEKVRVLLGFMSEAEANSLSHLLAATGDAAMSRFFLAWKSAVAEATSNRSRSTSCTRRFALSDDQRAWIRHLRAADEHFKHYIIGGREPEFGNFRLSELVGVQPWIYANRLRPAVSPEETLTVCTKWEPVGVPVSDAAGMIEFRAPRGAAPCIAGFSAKRVGPGDRVPRRGV